MTHRSTKVTHCSRGDWGARDRAWSGVETYPAQFVLSVGSEREVGGVDSFVRCVDYGTSS